MESSNGILNSNFLYNPIGSTHKLYQKMKRVVKGGIKRKYYQLQKRKPEILQFECTTPYITEGGFFQLRWKVINAYKVELSSIGDVTELSFLNFTANLKQKTFTLTAYSHEAPITETLTVHIEPFKGKTPTMKVKTIETTKLETSIANLRNVQVKAPIIYVKPIDMRLKLMPTYINKAQLNINTVLPMVGIQSDAISMQVKVPMIDQAKLDQIKDINDSKYLDLLLTDSELL